MAHKGLFHPRNPQKYKGNASNIVYRSSWELKLMSKLDLNPNVVWWQSEEIAIPYRCPTDGRVHRYFPDFLVCVRNRDGSLETQMIEVKPAKETRPPIKRSRVTRKYVSEVFTYGKNTAKWEAAEAYCKSRGYAFKIFTESELGIK